jgi:transcriptional regulator with XRE-family HTH domain
MPDKMNNQPPEMDVAIGRRIKECRRNRKMSQTKLADQVGLAWQQIQKYEGGKNRVSAAMLWKIADVFGVPISLFFDDIAGDFDMAAKAEAPAQEKAEEVVEMFSQLGRAEREAVYSFLQSVSDPENAKPASKKVAS